MNKTLLVDVGGTNLRYAIASKDSDDITDINKLPFDANDFEIHLEKLINDNDIEILVLSAAGPKINNSISMTNRNFTFDANDIKKIMVENNFREGANNNPGEFVLEKAFVD